MARRILAAVLAPVLPVLGAVAVAAPAQAATGCVTKAEYDHVSRPMTRAAVEKVFGAHAVNTAGGGAGAAVLTYRACDGVHQAQVTYRVPVHGAARMYTARWVAA